MKTFRQDLEELINKHSMENGSNTPDFILAEYLIRCLNTFDHITTIRNEWYGEKLIKGKIKETRNEFEKKIDEQKLFDDIDFNNLCARATLYPGKSIAEVNDLQFMERVEDSYKFINSVLLGTTPMNENQIRQWVTKTLEGRLKKYGVVAKCTEENNTPEVIDGNLLVARLMRRNPDNSPGFRFMDLVFGEEQKVRDFQISHYFDNAIYSFIGKGI